MDQRQSALRDWAIATIGLRASDVAWETVTADASSRRYFRMRGGEHSVVCADSPPETENNGAFLAVRSLLSAAGLPVPGLLAEDLERGFLLLEDFGDRHLQQALDTDHPPSDYLGALDLLLDIQAVDGAAAGLPPYDRALLAEEYSRFYQWFCRTFLEMPERSEDMALVEDLGARLIDSALSQPQVLVYRDYHCRNLMLRPDGSLGLIDFQDAVIGPLCYDLASLLRDCYIRWSPRQVVDWVLAYRKQLLARQRPAGDSDEQFLRWFDWIGLHRHLKVLGNFTRLALRDDKPGYLKDLPMVLRYVRAVLQRYPEFADFNDWFDDRVVPRFPTVQWEDRS